MKFTVDAKFETALLDTLLYVDAHLSDELTLDLLARRAGFSPYHFHRVFKQWIGEGVKGYIRRLRLERAAYRLKISDVPLLRLALESGYHTHETFTRAFARHFGINPGQYRTNLLLGAHLQRDSGQVQRLKLPAPSTSHDVRGLARQEIGPGVPRLEHVRSITVAFVRHTGVYDGVLEPGSRVADYWQELFRWGAATHLVTTDSLLLGIAQDDPSVTPAEKARFDVCVQVPAFHSPAGNIGCQTIAGGLFGVARHYGAFATLGETYRAIYQAFIASQEYQLRLVPPFEVYGYTRVRDDLEIHYTDVYIPLELADKPAKRKRSAQKARLKRKE